jgi:hypothetical protein
VLNQLLCAAMQQPYVRIDAFDNLAIELQDKAQHAMGRRMLRPKIDREIANGSFAHTGPS